MHTEEPVPSILVEAVEDLVQQHQQRQQLQDDASTLASHENTTGPNSAFASTVATSFEIAEHERRPSFTTTDGTPRASIETVQSISQQASIQAAAKPKSLLRSSRNALLKPIESLNKTWKTKTLYGKYCCVQGYSWKPNPYGVAGSGKAFVCKGGSHFTDDPASEKLKKNTK